MDAKDLQTLKTKLLDERGRLEADLVSLEESTSATAKESSGDLSSYSSHMADQGTDSMEREKAFLFAAVKRRRLGEIDSALARMETGKFGVCESCGKPIPIKRLERVPDASLCIACKEKEEKEQGATP